MGCCDSYTVNSFESLQQYTSHLFIFVPREVWNFSCRFMVLLWTIQLLLANKSCFGLHLDFYDTSWVGVDGKYIL